MKFFRKKERPQAYIVGWVDLMTGRTGHGIPIYSKTAAERFAERFNAERSSKVYAAEPCTPEILKEEARETIRRRLKQAPCSTRKSDLGRYCIQRVIGTTWPSWKTMRTCSARS